MSPKITLFILVLFALTLAVPAQQAKKVAAQRASKQLLIDAPEKETSVKTAQNSGLYVAKPQAGNWVLVDSSANAFGGANATITPLVFDPSANVLALVHRGHSAYGNSGQIWYNMSKDGGKTWRRISPALNGAISASGRYPAISISNPTKGDTTVAALVGAWPQLLSGGSGFGNLGYGVDAPIGAGQPFATEELGNFTSIIPVWASDKTPWIFWFVGNLTDNNSLLYKTQDYITIKKITVPGWDDANFRDSWGGYEMGGVSRNGIQYVGYISHPSSSFFPVLSNPDTINPIYPLFSQSTDDGETWSNLTPGDIYNVPAFKAKNLVKFFDNVKYDVNKVSYEGTYTVDKNNRIHFITIMTDTTGSMDGTLPYNNKDNSLVEFYQKDATTWDGKIICSGIPDSAAYHIGPGLGQMSNTPRLAVTKEGDIMVAQWAMPPVGKSIPWLDVYQSYRSINGEWSAPVNITNSDLINNSQSNLAPILASSGNSITAFSFYAYKSGATGPYTDTAASTNIYVAANTYSVTGVKDEVKPISNFELGQNYPNPFNPTTSISYTIPTGAKVTVKVFDLLGKEVATLVNDVKTAGTYKVNFDASKLASGMYIYSINAGNYSASRKMMLLK